MAKHAWINWFRSGSQLVAGLKITAAFLSYVGVGQVGRWLIDVFYPFTRIMWGDLFNWLMLPQVSDIEKDALTALTFFIPLGVSSVIAGVYKISDEDEGFNVGVSKEDRNSDTITAVVFGTIFFFLICGSLLSSIGN